MTGFSTARLLQLEQRVYEERAMSDEKNKFPDQKDASASKWLRRLGVAASAALVVVLVVVTGGRVGRK